MFGRFLGNRQDLDSRPRLDLNSSCNPSEQSEQSEQSAKALSMQRNRQEVASFFEIQERRPEGARRWWEVCTTPNVVVQSVCTTKLFVEKKLFTEQCSLNTVQSVMKRIESAFKSWALHTNLSTGFFAAVTNSCISHFKPWAHNDFDSVKYDPTMSSFSFTFLHGHPFKFGFLHADKLARCFYLLSNSEPDNLAVTETISQAVIHSSWFTRQPKDHNSDPDFAELQFNLNYKL